MFVTRGAVRSSPPLARSCSSRWRTTTSARVDCWSAKGKGDPRALARTDPALGARFSRSFEELFTNGDARAVIALAEDLLAPDGGLLFDGYRLDAPSSWRKPICFLTSQLHDQFVQIDADRESASLSMTAAADG